MEASLGKPIRVLVADDDPGVTSVVARLLVREGYAVRTCEDGERALHAAREWSPDAAILDVVMPGIDGVTLCGRLRTERPDLSILVLTARDSTLEHIAGLDAGADDYLVKPFSPPVLLAHLRAVLRRREPSTEVLTYADLCLDTATRRARRGEREIALTATEYKLLLHLLRSAGQVVPRATLTERVWGYDFDGNDNVLEVYVRYLRTKLEAGGEPRLIQTLRGAGYALAERPA